jgi:hypothetical protein
LLRFPDEDIDVEILYGTHLEDNESDFNGFEYIHKISEGLFSEIHKAKWKNTVVAVKQINFQVIYFLEQTMRFSNRHLANSRFDSKNDSF